MRAEAVEVYAWGKEWSPLVIAGTGTVMTLVYYPHKATADVIMAVRGFPVRCLICGEDVAGTKPHTRQAYSRRALLEHLRGHGRRTRKQNPALAKATA